MAKQPDLFTKERNPYIVEHYWFERDLYNITNSPDEQTQITWDRRLKENVYQMTKEQYERLSPADQLKALGYKSAPKHEIVTDQQLKEKRASRFEEDNIVNAWGKWFKRDYPGIPYTIDKVAQKRNKLAGVIMSASSYQRGNPDIFIQSPKAGFSGCYIEQKKSDDIFYAGTRILKPAPDNRHIWQSLYHADLREQGYWVMFSISLESSKKIAARYMAGNPYPQQAFEYYCKPEDYAMFEFHKHFKPVAVRP